MRARSGIVRSNRAITVIIEAAPFIFPSCVYSDEWKYSCSTVSWKVLSNFRLCRFWGQKSSPLCSWEGIPLISPQSRGAQHQCCFWESQSRQQVLPTKNWRVNEWPVYKSCVRQTNLFVYLGPSLSGKTAIRNFVDAHTHASKLDYTVFDGDFPFLAVSGGCCWYEMHSLGHFLSAAAVLATVVASVVSLINGFLPGAYWWC